MRCGVVWCAVVWCGEVWCGVVWYGVVWCGVVWCGVVWCGVVRCSAEWFGAVWCGVVWGSRGDEIALRHREGELLYRHPRAAVRDNVPVQIIIINPPNRATFQSRDVSKHQRQSRRGIDPEWGLLLLHCHCFRLGTHTPRDPPDGGTHTNTQKDTNTRPPSLASPLFARPADIVRAGRAGHPVPRHPPGHLRAPRRSGSGWWVGMMLSAVDRADRQIRTEACRDGGGCNAAKPGGQVVAHERTGGPGRLRGSEVW